MGRSRKPLQLWKQDSKEPDWYNKNPDPFHKVDQSCGVQDDLIANLTTKLKEWLSNHSADFDRFVNAEKQRWISKGGSKSVFDKALEIAFLKSNFYKILSKEC